MDVNGQLKNAQFEKSATDPILNVLEGRVYYDTSNDIVKWYTGAAWKTAVDTDSTQTISGKTFSSPTLTTPSLGVATATSINKVAITAPATSATLTIADGKTLTASNTLTFTGTDSSSVAFGAGGTAAYTGNKLSAFAATTSLELLGVISDETGSGSLVFGTSPALSSPVLTTPSVTTSATYSNQAEVRFAEQTGNGTNYIGLKAPDAVTANKVFKLPDGDGTPNQVLITDGSLQLGWGSSATVPAAGAVYSDGAALQSESQLALSRGGTNKSLTAAAGGVLWTDADSVEVSAAGTVGKVLASNGTSAPTWVPGQTDTNRITASYTVLDGDGYRTIIATTAPSNVTFSSRSSNEVTFSGAHGMLTGAPIMFNGSGTPPAGLTKYVTYYAIVTSSTACKFATSISDALAGTAVTITDDGSGTRTWAPGIAVVLPTAADNTDRRIVVKKSYAAVRPMVAIIPEASGETIDGSAGLLVPVQGDSYEVTAENGIWYVTGRSASSSGTYTPTITLVQNIGTLSATHVNKYSRIGTIVTVTGSIQATAVTNNTLHIFTVSLPFGSNLSDSTDIAGVSSALRSTIYTAGGFVNAETSAGTADDTASVEVFVNSGSTSSHFYYYTFQYEIK